MAAPIAVGEVRLHRRLRPHLNLHPVGRTSGGPMTDQQIRRGRVNAAPGVRILAIVLAIVGMRATTGAGGGRSPRRTEAKGLAAEQLLLLAAAE